MSKSIYRFFQCMIVLGLATYLAEKWISGRLSYYINPRFAILTLIGIIGLVIMAVIGLNSLFAEKQGLIDSQNKSEPKKQKTNMVVVFLLPLIVAFLGLSATVIFPMYFLIIVIGLMRLPQLHTDQDGQPQLSEIPGAALILLAIPLILGVIVPARPLSTSSLSTRGMNLSAPVSIEQQSIKTMEIAPDDRTVLDWIKIFNYEKDLSTYIGKSANVIGFVYHDPRLKISQFMVGRFAITCCVADAFAIGMVVDWPDSANLVDNSWVNVKGTVDALTIDGQKVPMLYAEAVNPMSSSRTTLPVPMRKLDRVASSVIIVTVLLLSGVIFIGNRVPINVTCQLSTPCVQMGPYGSIVFEFSRPVQAEQVEKLWQTVPPIEGKWEWLDDQHVRWNSLKPLPSDQKIMLQFLSGQAGQNGEHINQSIQWEVMVRSPQIIAVRSNGDGKELFTFGLDDESPGIQLTHVDGRVYDYQVSPDGEAIVFSVINDLKGIDLLDSSKRWLEPAQTSGLWWGSL